MRRINVGGDMAETMDSYKINERAWNLILLRVNDMLEAGETQASIARVVGCDRATINRWIQDRRGGERTTFRDMIRYLDRLRIPLQSVFMANDGELPQPSPDRAPTDLDKAIASILVGVAKAIGKDTTDIARELDLLNLPDVKAMLGGRASMRASDFSKICRAVGVDPGAILKRAETLQGED
jgi:transcriptional regulator with XRE-family HTH domain